MPLCCVCEIRSFSEELVRLNLCCGKLLIIYLFCGCPLGLKLPLTPVPARRKAPQHPNCPAPPITSSRSECNLSAPSELRTNSEQQLTTEKDVLIRRIAPPVPATRPLTEKHSSFPSPIPVPRRDTKVGIVRDLDSVQDYHQMAKQTKRDSVSETSGSAAGDTSPSPTSLKSPFGLTKDGAAPAKPVVSIAPRLAPGRPTLGPTYQRKDEDTKHSVDPSSLSSE